MFPKHLSGIDSPSFPEFSDCALQAESYEQNSHIVVVRNEHNPEFILNLKRKNSEGHVLSSNEIQSPADHEPAGTSWESNVSCHQEGTGRRVTSEKSIRVSRAFQWLPYSQAIPL